MNLLDSALGRPLQTWDFADRDRLTIGRSPENDVSVTDPQVSRLHVELIFLDGAWQLVSHGRNGTWIRGSKVDRVGITHHSIFQLGSNGPSLQILLQEIDTETRSATIDSFDPGEFDFLDIDRQFLADEVTKIAESEAFQRLQSESQRQRRSDADNQSDHPGDNDRTMQ